MTADPGKQAWKTTVLADWMEAKAKTAADIAQAVGFDAPTIRRFAEGALGYGVILTQKFAKVFNVTVEEFKAGPDPKNPRHSYNPKFNTPAMLPFSKGSKETVMAEGGGE